MRRALLLALCLLVAAPSAGDSREPCASHDPLRQPWFGDLHVHTRHSLDASTQGTRTTPREAYRFARGERIGLHPFGADGKPQRSAQLDRPLDFAAVTDHAELFGETHLCNTVGSPAYDAWVCRIYRGWPRLAFFFMNARGNPRFGFCGEDSEICRTAARTPWREMRDAAEEAYDRTSACQFTSFVGYEWTKVASLASNLHRNVIFQNEHVPEYPAGATDAETAEALWDALDADCRDGTPGCEALVIPHNSNLSSGLMFASDGLDRDSATRRLRNEPLVEVMQHKGSSECRFGAGTTDELCDFEVLPYDSFLGRFAASRSEANPASFARNALGRGLALGREIGANPFAFGMIGSTDTHLGTPGLASERDYPGHGGAGIPVGDRLPEGLLDPIEYNPGGLAVVWAEENSRSALFAAMQRREVYATSGPRIVLRMFAGAALPDDLCREGDFAARGYAVGVPMGGTLPAPIPGAPATPPAIAVSALRDAGPDGSALQRLQVIKLSLDATGNVVEHIADVATANLDATVDDATCTPEGEGAKQLCGVWRDFEFDPRAPALYYARVVENPSCRWSTRVCNAAGVDCSDASTIGAGYEPCCDERFPKTIQERAWSSPIWFTPDP